MWKALRQMSALRSLRPECQAIRQECKQTVEANRAWPEIRSSPYQRQLFRSDGPLPGLRQFVRWPGVAGGEQNGDHGYVMEHA